MQNVIKIFHTVQEIGPVSLFQNITHGSRVKAIFFFILTSEEPRPMRNDICQNLGLGSVSLFKVWTSAKPRPMRNDIWPSLGLHLVKINVYAKADHGQIISKTKTARVFILVYDTLFD